ncbi:hypothetical protein, partial [Roseomonas harenae]|uniref:hypothetical protein n=1 Tax=Muricoccus harenae TaxID=2692566 RepID=UPI0013319B51
MLAFFLTGVLGVVFSKMLDDWSRQRQVEATVRERAVESLREITDLLYERRTRSELVASSIRRDAGEAEVRARKSAYDDAYIRWNTKLQSNLFRIREMTSGAVTIGGYSRFEFYAERYLVPLLLAADACITSAYDTYLTPANGSLDSARKKLDTCSMRGAQVYIRDIHRSTVTCSYAFTDALFMTVRAASTRREKEEDLSMELERRCRVP